MAIIKFKDTHSLINYLCKEDVLGELEVDYSYAGMGWDSEFNFDYPKLEEHLNIHLFEILSSCWTVSKLKILFENSEDYHLTGTDDLQHEGFPYGDEILQIVSDLIKEYKGRNNVYAYISFVGEGDSYEIDDLKINQFEIFDWDMEEESIIIEDDLRNIILNKILTILSDTQTGIECITNYEFSMENDESYYCATGSPGCESLPNLKDEMEFELDTTLLLKKFKDD